MTDTQLAIPTDDGSVKSKRTWTSNKSWGHIKDFVIAERQRGQKPQLIRIDLEHKGIPITRNQLQRLMKEWGVADMNLQRRHKKYIFEYEQLHASRRKIFRWSFKVGTSKQRVKQATLESIRRGTIQDFEGVKSSPGALVLSPIDIHGSPSQASHSPGMSLDEDDRVIANEVSDSMEISEDIEVQTIDGDYEIEDWSFTEGSMKAPESVNDPSPKTPMSSSLVTISRDTIDNDDDEIFSILGAASKASSMNSKSDSGLEKSSAEPSTLPELLSKISDDIALYLKNSNRKNPLSLTRKFSESFTPEEFTHYLSLIFRSNMEREKDSMYAAGRSFIQEIEDLIFSTPLTLKQCEDIAVQKLTGHQKGFAFMPYEGELCIVNGTWLATVSKSCNVFNAELEQKILELFYGCIFELWAAVGSDDATFTTRNDRADLYKMNRLRFRGYVIHLPYLIQTNGMAYWMTLIALNEFCHLYQLYYEYRPQRVASTIPILEYIQSILEAFEYSTFLEDILGMLADSFTTTGRHEDAAKMAQKRFMNAKTRYGDRDLRTIHACAVLREKLSKISDEGMVEQLSAYMGNQIKQMQSRGSIESESEMLAIATILETQVSSANAQEMIDITRILTLQDRNTSPKNTIEIKLPQDQDDYVFSETTKAQVHYFRKDLMKSMQALYNATHRFPDTFHTLWSSEGTVRLATEVMTARGLVRYSQPTLERLIRICEREDKPDEDRFYQKLVFAAGSVAFELAIESGYDDLGAFIMP